MPLMSYTFHNIQLQVIIADPEKANKFHNWLRNRFLRPEDQIYREDTYQIHCTHSVRFNGLPVMSFDFKSDQYSEGITANGENVKDVLECVNEFVHLYEFNLPENAINN